MNKHINLASLFAIFVILTVCIASPGFSQAIDMKWDYVIPGSTMGWTANSDVASFKQKAGFLSGEVKGQNPQVISPEFKLVPSNNHVAQIVMMSNKEGVAKLYWANTLEEPQGGFRPEKVLEFKVPGDNKLHSYDLLPFWKKDGQIIKLRIDPPAGSTFKIDHVRILRLPPTQGSPTPKWNFFEGPGSWLTIRGFDVHEPREASMVVTNKPDSLLLSPDVTLDTAAYKWVTVEMKASAGSNASILWVTDKETGQHKTTFPIISDGQVHTYNVLMKNDQKWQGSVVRLGLNPSDADAEVQVRTIAVGPVRQGPAEVIVKSLKAPADVNQAGKETKITAVLQNNGGEAAKDLNVVMNLPKGVELKSGQLVQKTKDMDSGAETTLEWVVVSKDTGESTFELEVTGKNIPKVKNTSKVKWSETGK